MNQQKEEHGHADNSFVKKLLARITINKLAILELIYKIVLFLCIPNEWAIRVVGFSFVFPIFFLVGSTFKSPNLMLPYLLYNTIWMVLLDLCCLALTVIMFYVPEWWKETLFVWHLVSDKNDASQKTFFFLFLTAFLAAYTHMLRKMTENAHVLVKTKRITETLPVECSMANVEAKSDQSLNDVV